MSRLPYIPSSYAGRSTAFESQRLINLYAELAAGADPKGVGMLVGVPGKRLFSSGLTASVRGAIAFNGLLYVVESNKFVSVDTSGAATVLGTLNTSAGRVSMAENGVLSAGIGGNQICVVDDLDGWIYNILTSAFTQISSPGFPVTPSHVEYIDSYFIVTNGTMGAYASDSYNGLSWNVLAYTPVQAASDNVQNLINLHQQLFFIKEYTSEVYYNNGTATSVGFPFSRLQGAVIDYGTPAPWSVARGNNSIFFLANERDGDNACFVGVVELSGYTPVPITPPSIVYRMSQSTDHSQCFGYCYSDEGHTFYVLTNPVDNWTFVYDTTTQMWHERATCGLDNSNINRDRANCYVRFNDMHLVGDSHTGNVYEVSSKFNTDAGLPIISTETTQHLIDNNSLDDVFIDELRIDIESGVGLDDVSSPAVAFATLTAPGGGVSIVTMNYNGADYTTAPAVILRAINGNGSGATATATVYEGSVQSVTVTTAGTGYTSPPEVIFAMPEVTPFAGLSRSKDGGKTWGAESIRSMGNIGEYRKRLLWRSVGRSKDVVFKLRISSPVKRIIMGWYVEASQ